jgi:peptide/nickel transport system permease protein
MLVLRRLLGRVAGIAFAILAIATINFVLVHSAPGDPALVIAGQSGATDAKFIGQMRAEYGLDQPYLVQLGTYLGKVARLDLGYSHRQRRAVGDLILERLGPTLLLTFSAFFLSLIGGIVFGSLAGLRHGRWSDLAISLISLLLYATPVFWLGLMLVLVFSIQLEWLPAFGYTDIRAAGFGTFGYALDVAWHLVLPAITLAAIYMAVYTRLMRSSLIEVSHEDHVRTARAKGLTDGAILRGHMLRNAAVPVVTSRASRRGR